VNVAIVHDYLTQAGGAERVVLEMARAFPGAPVYTALYEPDATFAEFREIDVRPSALNRVGPFRREHRRALPFLAPAFSRRTVRADVVLVSSSGWAHGVATTAPKVVYCHAPARWLYQTDVYVGGHAARRLVLAPLKAPLLRWDRRAAATATRYLANSTVTRDRVKDAYGIDADVLFPPPGLVPDGPLKPIPRVDPGFLLVVSRLLPYKNVDLALAVGGRFPDRQVVVVGQGPEWAALRAAAPDNAVFVPRPDDAKLRWLYANAAALLAPSYEDFGLTPLEAAGLGTPTVALRGGGYLDTIRDGVTGVFFDTVDVESMTAAVRRALATPWPADVLREHAAAFGPDRFAAALRAAVTEAAG
jgi:glycosyltransferase involved in cell wall biosynthesis